MAKNPRLSVGLVFDDSLDSNDGVAQYVKTVGAWLSDQGHDIHYLVGQTSMAEWHGGKVHSLAANLKVRFNGNNLSMPLLSKKARLRAALNQGEFDVLHVMVPYSPLMAQRLIRLAAPKTTVVGTFHILPSGNISKIGSRLLAVVSAPSLKRFTAFASVSPPAQDFARRTFRINSVVIPNPVNIKKFQTNQVNHQKRIVFLGRLVKRKGCGQLIEAFAKAAAAHPDYELVIAGDGPQRGSLESLVARLGLQDRIRFLGRIDEADKPKLLASATIACFPSLYGESFGIVLIEAMAAGAQVVLGGNNPGYASVLGGRQELLFDPADTDQLAQKISDMLQDPKRRRAIAAWQKQEVKKYDIKTVGAQLESFYQAAIAKKGHSRHN